MRKSCDGAGLLEAFRAAVANLADHVDEINGLNVFPVPDGDTGSNMLATVHAALEEAEGVAGEPAERIASAISFGALMGARGNSGVITSQIFRGMADGLGGKRQFNGLDLAHALSEGARTAYGAVAKPVEGTILTVIRESAAVAVEVAERTSDIEAVLAATVDAAEKSVARTPSLLPILREAGVVDSGGQGLYRLFQGALLSMLGQAPIGDASARVRAGAKASALIAHADEGFGYETMYLLQARPGERLDVDALRDHLDAIGESVLVAGDARALKVHVHNERPDLVIGHGLTLGALSRISVENLDNQARDVRETRAADFTGATWGDDGASASVAAAVAPPLGPVTGSSNPGTAVEPMATAKRPRQPLAVIAVASGDGLEAIFRDFGVAAVVRGGQQANPSTGELLAAVEAVDADEILLLPNNPNVVLAARQVISMVDRPMAVVPTRNAAEGFAALLAMDPTRGAADNVEGMTAAGRGIGTLAATEAVRDATIGGTKVREGQTIVLDPDDGLVACDDDRETAILTAVGTLPPGFELITLYYGDGTDLAEAERLARLIGEQSGGIETEIVHGGQPLYRYLIAVE
ncbi:MAG: DAK2 domain-containing protein [Chloroflexota bacterium]